MLTYNKTVHASNTVEAVAERSPVKNSTKKSTTHLTASDIKSAAVSAPIPYMDDNNSVPGRRWMMKDEHCNNNNHPVQTQNDCEREFKHNSPLVPMPPTVEDENDDSDSDSDKTDEAEDHSSTRSGLGTVTTGVSSLKTYNLVLAERYVAHCGKQQPTPAQPSTASSRADTDTRASSNLAISKTQQLKDSWRHNTVKNGTCSNHSDDEKMAPPPNNELLRRSSSDIVTQLLIDEKRRQAGGYINHDLDMYLYPETPAAGNAAAASRFVNRNQHHRHTTGVDNGDGSGADGYIHRDDETISSFTENNSLSTAPEPPSLREYRGTFFKPGAYRIKEDGEARQADLDSCVSSIRTHSTVRTNRTNWNQDIEVVGVVDASVPVEATVVADDDDYLVVHADPIPVNEHSNNTGDIKVTRCETAPAARDDDEGRTSDGKSELGKSSRGFKALFLCFRRQNVEHDNDEAEF
jgi:hypothetical protein